mgnify:CR=1 FL=1|tara:strand:- start:923 stop:1093 length:171 start_codon:yes stop_codon:yes gene_type:complete
MKKILIFIFLTSCISPNSNDSSSDIKLNFNDDLSFEDFNEMLIEYAKISPYPNIDK